MTIIAIIVAFALCHFFKELGEFRRHGWLAAMVTWCNNRLSFLPGWPGLTSFAVILGIPLLLLTLLVNLVDNLADSIGLFALSVIVLIYSFGPRDLDAEVSELVAADDDEQRQRAATRLLGETPPQDPDQAMQRISEAVFIQALRRWFAIIFWFAVLGPIGALLYRLADWLVADQALQLSERQRGAFWRLREVLEWPVAQLMTLGLAVAADFDSVFQAWRDYHRDAGHSLFEGDNQFLKAAVCRIMANGDAANDGFADQLTGATGCVQQAMDLVWRVLAVWLTVLALLLLAGWIA